MATSTRGKEKNMATIYVKGAYGRTYRNEGEMMADWNGGRDFFSITDNCYCSKRDFEPGGDCVMDYAVFMQDGITAPVDLVFYVPKVV